MDRPAQRLTLRHTGRAAAVMLCAYCKGNQQAWPDPHSCLLPDLSAVQFNITSGECCLQSVTVTYLDNSVLICFILLSCNLHGRIGSGS